MLDLVISDFFLRSGNVKQMKVSLTDLEKKSSLEKFDWVINNLKRLCLESKNHIDFQSNFGTLQTSRSTYCKEFTGIRTGLKKLYRCNPLDLAQHTSFNFTVVLPKFSNLVAN